MNPKYELAILMTVLGIWDEAGLISDQKIQSEFEMSDVIFIATVLDSISGDADDGSAVDETFARVKELLNILKEKND